MSEAKKSEMEAAAARAERSGWLARLGHPLFRWRSFTPVPLLLIALPFLYWTRGAPHSPLWEILGLACCVAGQALRAWVIGQVPDGTSGQNEKLIATGLNQSGPYSHTRNPLYLGNLGISLGLALISHSLFLTLLLAVTFFLQYAAIISVEEAFLRERFGADYDRYCAAVPRFWPRISAANASETSANARPWSLARAIRKEHNPICAWLLLALLFMGLDRAKPALLAGQPLHLLPQLLMAATVITLWLIAKGWKHHWLSGNFKKDLKRRLRETVR